MDTRTIQIEATAAAALLRSVAEAIADDDEAAAAVIEGETNLIEAMTLAIERIETLTQYCSAIKARQDDLSERRQRYVVQIERIKSALLGALTSTGQRKIETPLATISVRRVASSVVIVDAEAIPSAYQRQRPPEPDKIKIAAALKDGQAVEGAQLSNGSETIAIKTR